MAINRIEVIEANIEHFSQDGAEFSIEDTGNDYTAICLYRQDFTSTCPVRCGIGVVIPDHLYDTDFEHVTASELAEIYPDVFGEIFSEEIDGDFMDFIQSTHDQHAGNGKTVAQFVSALRELLIEEENGISRFA